MTVAKRAAKSYFTQEEANQRLPLVRVIVDDIVRLFRYIHDRRERLGKIRPVRGEQSERNVYSEEVDQMKSEIDQDIERLEGYIAELQALGVELKDPVAGLVDFPAIVDGSEAYLCWKLGEGDIQYWHDRDSGFAGRQPLLQTSVCGKAHDEE